MALACFSQAQNAFWNVSNQKQISKVDLTGISWNMYNFSIKSCCFQNFLIKHVGLESSNNHATPVQLPFRWKFTYILCAGISSYGARALLDKYPKLKTYKEAVMAAITLCECPFLQWCQHTF